MTTPRVKIRKRDQQWGWMRVDFREDEDIEAIVVIPTWGPTHNAGLDCWCCPANEDGVFVHNEVH